jgi:hypothetical protein
MSRPTLFIAGVDRERSYYFWQWLEPELSPRQAYTIDRKAINALAERISAAIPVQRSGETEEAMAERVLTKEAFANLEEERKLSSALSSLLLPTILAEEIAGRFIDNGRTPIHVRLLPSALSAQMPWVLLPIPVPQQDGTVKTMRLIEVADLTYEVPAGIHVGRARLAEPWTDDTHGVLYVVDPLTKVTGQVLDDQGVAAFKSRLEMTGTVHSGLQSDFTRHLLHQILTAPVPPARLVFVGHVVTSDVLPGAASLILSDDEKTFGVMRVIERKKRKGKNRPLSALDFLEGTQNSQTRLLDLRQEERIPADRVVWPTDHHSPTSGSEIWPMPPRVALIACNSGADMRNPEPFGLALSLVNAGAELVTATKWALPTDAALGLFGGSTSHAFVNMALSVDDAHATADPVVKIAQWQREKLREWEVTGAIDASPILWASLSTYLAQPREVVTAVPERDFTATPWRLEDTAMAR